MTHRFPFRLIAALWIFSVPNLSAQEPAEPPKPAEATKKDPALEQYYIANAAYNRKIYPVAVAQFDAFLKKHGEHAKANLARRGLALGHYALKDYEKAMAPLATLLAEKELDKGISRERLIMVYGQCLLLSGKRDEARTLFEAEIETLVDAAYRSAALAAICDVCFGKAEWKEVVGWSEKLLSEKPDAAKAARGLYQQGFANYRLGEHEAAIASLEKIAALGGDATWGTRASYLLGECFKIGKQYDKAEAAFVAALPGLKGGDASECQYRLGLTRFVLKKYKESAADFAAYLKLAEDGAHAPNARLYVARCALELGEFAEAETALTELVGGEGAVAAMANLWLARVHTRRDKGYAKAAELLGPAVEKFAESPVIDDLRFDYANALMARPEPDWKSALEVLRKVAENSEFGQRAELVSQQSVCLHKLGNYEASLAANTSFLSVYAEHAQAGDVRFMRAENLFLMNRLDEAAKAYAEFTAAGEGHPNIATAAFRLAQIDHDQGRWEDCLAKANPLYEKKPSGGLYAPLPFIVGDCQFRLQKWAEAIPPLEAFVASHVKKGEVVAGGNVDTALMQLAVAYDRTGEQAKAQGHLLTLISHFKAPTLQRPLALAEQGRLAYEAGDLKLARVALEAFLAEEVAGEALFAKGAPAQKARVMYYLGWVDAGEGDHAAAATRFAELLKVAPDHQLAPDASLQLGIAWVNGKKYDAAAKHFMVMLEKYPKHEKLARAVFYTGLALARQKQWDLAGGQFKRITEAFPKSEFADQALYERAWCERMGERMEEAAKLYEALLASHPESPLAVKVQSELAELNLDSGAQEKVIERLTATLKDLKDETFRETLRYQLASAHFKKGDYENAATQFEALLTDYPESKLLARTRFQAGESQLKLGGTEAARDHFAAAAAAISGGSEQLAESVVMRLGETQALTGQHKEAAATYASFLQRFAESRWKRNAQFGLAFATESAGGAEAALPEYQKLLGGTVDLWAVRSRFQRGVCLAALGRNDEALVEFVNVEISYPQYPTWQASALFEIGRVMLAQKKSDAAVDRFKEVIKRFAKEPAAADAKAALDKLAEG